MTLSDFARQLPAEFTEQEFVDLMNVITRLAPPAAICPNGLRNVHSDVANDVSEMEGACGAIYSGSSGGVVGVIKISC